MAEEVYKIVLADDWERAVSAGQFLGAGIDLTDGFIHLSTRNQVQETLDRYFQGQRGLLLITLCIDRLEADLRWENAISHGETPSDREGLFPHLYGIVTMDMVANVAPIQQDASGRNRVAWNEL